MRAIDNRQTVVATVSMMMEIPDEGARVVQLPWPQCEPVDDTTFVAGPVSWPVWLMQDELSGTVTG